MMMTVANMAGAGEAGPRRGPAFDLDNEAAYRRWRADKLAAFTADRRELTVAVADAGQLSPAERRGFAQAVGRANLAIFRLPDDHPRDKASIAAFGRQLGLHRLDHNLCAGEDGITTLRAGEGGGAAEYIPYTSSALSWHTDGYYNSPQEQVRGLLMFCVNAAAEGGENALLDHEIAYILLRDRDPEFIAALMHPEVMSIPANVKDGTVIRPERIGPVFSVDPRTGHLHMRYTARRRNIQWRDDPTTRAAVEFLSGLLADPDLPYLIRYRLRPGEGIVCNNVLHNRSAFVDATEGSQVRCLYRARYHDRVALA